MLIDAFRLPPFSAQHFAGLEHRLSQILHLAGIHPAKQNRHQQCTRVIILYLPLGVVGNKGLDCFSTERFTVSFASNDVDDVHCKSPVPMVVRPLLQTYQKKNSLPFRISSDSNSKWHLPSLKSPASILLIIKHPNSLPSFPRAIYIKLCRLQGVPQESLLSIGESIACARFSLAILPV